jgi:hypothetical protein
VASPPDDNVYIYERPLFKHNERKPPKKGKGGRWGRKAKGRRRMDESKYPELNDRDWLYQKYRVEKKSLHEIGDLLGCEYKRVWRALKREGIPRRTISESRKGQYPSEETKQKLRGRRKSKYGLLNDERWLRQKYHTERLTLTDIQIIVGCPSVDTVWYAFERLGIERRTLSDIGKEQIGDKNSFFGKHHTKDTKDKIAEIQRKQWESEEYIQNWMEGKNRYPNKLESVVYEILQKLQPNEWKYNGNFEEGVMLGGMIPDFINVNGVKRVIEVFGDYWHSDEVINGRWKRSEFGRKAVYSQLGYDCVVLWENRITMEGIDYITEEMNKT